MDFDDLLVNHLGQFGKYQIILYFTICLVGIPAAFNNMAIVFLAGVPNHWCATPELKRYNITDEARWNLTVPQEKKEGEWVFSKCEVYNRSFSGWSDSDANMSAQAPLQARNFSKGNCPNGWNYDHSQYESTIVTEWDLVCDLQLLQATAASVYMAGLMVGVLAFGQVSDWIGRKWAICICIVFMTGFNIGVAFSPGYIVFFVLRFMVALCTISLFTTGFVFGMEIVGPKWRVFAGFVIELFWAFGYMAVAGVAYGIRNWRTLQLLLSCPLAILLLYIFVLPESPRWLYAKKKKVPTATLR